MGLRGIAVHGHRGARACRPENTIVGFNYAIAAGVDAIELDVVLTADGVPVVAHHPRPGLTFDELRRREPSIPTLAETLALASPDGFLFNVELKPHAQADTFAAAVAPLIAPLAGRVMITSFDFALLRAVGGCIPGVPLGAIFARTDEDFVSITRRAGADFAAPEFHLVTRGKIEAAHAAAIPVFTWTANRPENWRALIDAGVDAIITDDPAALIAYLKTV